jgi:uncharacterized protein (TIGR02594 family)
MSKLVEHILSNYYGIKEFIGKDANSPTIMKWKQNVIPHSTYDEQYSWCAIFIHNMLNEVGLLTLPLSEAAGARNYLKLGIETTEPKLGDLVVFKRGTGWQGHVALFIRKSPDGKIWVLGGNQSDAVNISAYSEKSLLGYRRIS